MKIFVKENWFKLGVLLLAFLWIFFNLIYPKFIGKICFDNARSSVLNSGDSSNAKEKFDLFYEVCRDSFGL